MVGAASTLPLPLRVPLLADSPETGFAPARCDQVGWETESLLPLASNRSARTPGTAAAFDSWTATRWIPVCVAATTREVGNPLFMTRLLLTTNAVDTTVWFRI